MAPRCTPLMMLISHLTATNSPDRHFWSHQDHHVCLRVFVCFGSSVFVYERKTSTRRKPEECCVVCGRTLIMIVNGGLPRWHLLSATISLSLAFTRTSCPFFHFYVRWRRWMTKRSLTLTSSGSHFQARLQFINSASASWGSPLS